MTLNKTQKIVERLYKRTESGEVEWEATGNALVFQVAFSEYTVLVEETSSEGTILIIINSEGVTIEVIRYVDLSDDQKTYSRLSAIHEGARRTALQVDEALDNLLDELGG